LREPDVGSLSKTIVLASRSKIIEASSAPMSPYIPLPNDKPSFMKIPSLNAVATVSIYLGDGFEIPNLWMMRNARKGATFW